MSHKEKSEPLWFKKSNYMAKYLSNESKEICKKIMEKKDTIQPKTKTKRRRR